MVNSAGPAPLTEIHRLAARGAQPSPLACINLLFMASHCCCNSTHPFSLPFPAAPPPGFLLFTVCLYIINARLSSDFYNPLMLGLISADTKGIAFFKLAQYFGVTRPINRILFTTRTALIEIFFYQYRRKTSLILLSM